jgi:hypothetical protein
MSAFYHYDRVLAQMSLTENRRPGERKWHESSLARRSAPADCARKLIREIGGTPDDGLTAEWERVVAPLSRPDDRSAE